MLLFSAWRGSKDLFRDDEHDTACLIVCKILGTTKYYTIASFGKDYLRMFRLDWWSGGKFWAHLSDAVVYMLKAAIAVKVF
jgi:hypothetical protein